MIWQPVNTAVLNGFTYRSLANVEQQTEPKTGKLTGKEERTPLFPETHLPDFDYLQNPVMVSKYLSNSEVESREFLSNKINNEPLRKF